VLAIATARRRWQDRPDPSSAPVAQGFSPASVHTSRRDDVPIAAVLMMTFALVTASQGGGAADAKKAFEEGNAFFEKTENDKALAAYERAIALDGKQPDFHLARCRTLARLQRHADAIAGCTDALTLKPDFAAALLDRGHFLINARQVDRALPDLLRARELNADAYGVAYHLALAHYLMGDYAKAAAEYENCVANAKTEDNRIACSAWQYAALARAGRKDEAAKVLDRAGPDVKVQSSAAYLDRLLLFKGAKSEEAVAAAMEKDNLQLPTVAYGLGLWHLLNGRESRAKEYFEKATAPGAQQSAFGSVAAYYELQRMKK
jgi:tetratricopeptide (TPR) repeat protein